MGQATLYDLNVAWSPSTTEEQLLQMLSLASSLGYGTVALNHSLTQAPPADHKAPFPTLPSASSSSSSKPDTPDQTTTSPRLPNILHRATIPLSDPAASTYRLPALTRVYDLLAVRPLSKDAFQNACIFLDVALISLDLTQHQAFHFRPKTCMAAVARGVRFEICYGQVIGGSGSAVDARGRATFIANMTELVRATRGRGIVVSSEAKSALGLRPPADVVNLMSVWGLSREHGMEGLRSIPRSVVVNEGLKRSGYKTVVDIVQVAKRDPSTAAPREADENKTREQGSSKKGNKKQKQKRKNGEGTDSPQAGEAPQNKKMKLVSRDANHGK